MDQEEFRIPCSVKLYADFENRQEDPRVAGILILSLLVTVMQ